MSIRKKIALLIVVMIALSSLMGCAKNGQQNNLETGKDIDIKDEKTISLNTGYKMPTLGLGTWTFTGEECEEAVYEALKDGYRLIDTAQYYGNETEVGNALKKAINDGIVKREDVFITTKVSPLNYGNPEESIDESLKKLGLDYIDLFLVHQAGENDENVYAVLCQAVKDGKVRSIGISNFYNLEEYERITKNADIKPAVIQNENHIFYQNSQLQKDVSKYGTVIEAYYPFGGRGNTSESLQNETIVAIANKYNKTAAQILLKWQIQAGYVVVQGSKNPEHILENIDIFDFELSYEDMQEIEKLNTNTRYENW